MNKISQWKIDNTWTLFLDRDGVINERIPGDYVKRVADFIFLPGVLPALKKLSYIFGKIIVVTNQQGIGKGLYTHDELAVIHAFMKTEVERAGGKIDAVYYAPDLAGENSPFRKPGIGMAIQAKRDFPEIDFSKSVMAGDSESDIEFAKRAGMKSVFVGEKIQGTIIPDFNVASLEELAERMIMGE